MGFPTNETDELWKDLYRFGISKITEEEAKKLPHPTLPIPGTKDYLIQLDIWHELHCLNDLRMLLYPERFPGLAAVTDENGVIDRTSIEFRHWDHCVDSIREALMCHADVAPIPFRVNFPANKVIVPRLATTHTCRNFKKIQEWAKAHRAGAWSYKVTPEQAEEIMRASGFDNAPWEDIQDQYMAFPGNPYFKYWREHPEEAERARQEAAEGKKELA
ncbi:6fb56bcd-a67c-49f4-8b90-2ac61adbe7f0 [Thermothielavioides terrestris]|nr:6fb56bcd-a67c-49f4-8b90-2ac61adbe7f0 [Thermothielavioides terrestris]